MCIVQVIQFPKNFRKEIKAEVCIAKYMLKSPSMISGEHPMSSLVICYLNTKSFDTHHGSCMSVSNWLNHFRIGRPLTVLYDKTIDNSLC